MLQLSSIDYWSPLEIATILFVLLILAFFAGYKTRQYKIQKSVNYINEEMGLISSTLLGLLALILAFSFGMANSRFDTRRSLAIEEANAIGTVILRAEVFPDSMRKELKLSLKNYLEERIAFNESGTDVEKILFHFNKSDELGKTIWKQISEYSRKDLVLVKTSEIIPALNEMIDLTTSRRAAGEANIPNSIQWFLIILCVFSTFLLGYERKNKLDWIIVVGFSLMLSLTVFSIMDLDRPRFGLVTLEEENSKFIELRALFKQEGE
ncbi:hypothetical protein [Algoriphagus sp. AK58]|uniref:bestrophin-like domain n=1 Tax=Algoriphagus sp. AK58 TaxID=1406877 RepID=UPI00164FC1E7|nr:hypothetical protein [Algoriphagus sp. AK58]MBC6365411.1 hypothetical protein [Algoriphagus sp. AK58]